MQKAKLVDKTKGELIALYIAVAAMYLIPAMISTPFRSAQNITNILNQMAPIGFVALGQTFPILTTGIDLSVGPVVSMTTALAATYMGFTVGATLRGLAFCLGAGLAVGIVNGWVITRLRVEPLIATLGSSGVVSGITLMIRPYPGGYVPPNFTNLWSYRIGDIIPLGFIYFLLALFICHFILNFTRFGRRVYAIGGNDRKALVAGIHVNRVKMGVYILSAIFATIGGLSLAARMRSGDPLAGNPFTLSAIAAVVVGGTTFAGGVGGVMGTAAGVAILGLLSVTLNIFGVSPFYQNILAGVIVVAAVIYSSFRSKLAPQGKGV